MSSFTLYFSGLANKLKCDVIIEVNGQSVTVPAEWDTGATNTVIAKEVVEVLGLIPYRATTVQTPATNTPLITHTYIVNLNIVGKMQFTNWEVMLANIGKQGIGLLIGMDIIKHGDLAISNYANKTVMSFRMPSKAVIDYTTEE